MSVKEVFDTPADCTIRITRGCVPKKNADNLLQRIQREIPFQQYTRKVYGKDHAVPRRFFIFGDANIATVLADGKANPNSRGYTYSAKKKGDNYPIFEWGIPLEILTTTDYTRDVGQNTVIPDSAGVYTHSIESELTGPSIGMEIKRIMDGFNAKTGLNFNCALLNEYSSPRSYIPLHVDHEALGRDNAVVAISLGETRDFYFYPTKAHPEGENAKKILTYTAHGDVMVMSGKCQVYYMHTVPKRAKAGYRVSITFRHISA